MGETLAVPVWLALPAALLAAWAAYDKLVMPGAFTPTETQHKVFTRTVESAVWHRREHALELETKIVVQPGGVVLLNDKPRRAFNSLGQRFAHRLAGLAEIALLLVLSQSHRSSNLATVTDRRYREYANFTD